MNDKTPSWLQRNAFLVAAAGLPIIVVVFFLAATEIPKWTVEDPTYDPVFALTRYDNRSADYALEFKVENGRLLAIVKCVPDNGYASYQQLYRYHVDTGELEEIPVDVPDAVLERLGDAPSVAGKSPPSESFEPGVLTGVALNTRLVAPDGYEFVHEYSGNRGLFGELFGMGGGRYRLGLTRSGRFVAITPADEPAPYRYNNATFLGWMEASE